MMLDEVAIMGLSPMATAESQNRALQYFEQLKSSPKGWKICAEVLAKGLYLENDYVRFFCFQVLEHYLKTQYSIESIDQHNQIKTALLSWLQFQCVNPPGDKTFIRNKAAQVFSLVLVVDYPIRWPSYFADLLSSLNMGPAAVDVYLRILQQIDSEVVDREIVHSQQEAERNTAIKDAMREQCVVQIVDSWYQILTTYASQAPELACLCLDVIGLYISWIDIALIANDKFVSLLLQFIQAPVLRESTCDTIHEIICKGMDPVEKTELIESFTSVLETAGIMNTADDDESDFLSKVSKLVNGMGVQLISSLHKSVKANNPDHAARTTAAIERKIALMLKFLGNDDDDVSAAVITFAHDYVSMLKQNDELARKHRENVENLLYVIIKKMKYDESYCFEHEGEEESMFIEYRKQLKILINNIAQLDSELYLLITHRYVTQTLTNWKTVDYADVEVAIQLVYQIAEAIPVSSQHGPLMTSGSRLTVLQELMRLLCECSVNEHPHIAVKLMFFETVTRYDKYFAQEPRNLAEVVVSFLDERGLRNASPQVRSRTAYLFSRLVKGPAKSHMQDYIEDILKRMHDLLTLNSPDNGCSHLLSTDDQLFMYETASILIVHGNFTMQKKQILMKTLLAPIVTKFEGIFAKMNCERDEQRQLMFAECLVSAMAFASRTSKGFTNNQNMQQCGCVAAFTDTLKVFLLALDSSLHRQILHAGVRQYLHRMVVCLGGGILPYIPMAMDNLLKHADAREIHDFLPLLNQLIIKFKETIVPFLQQVFMPVVTTIFQVLNSPSDALDQVVANDKKLLQRSYYNFLLVIMNNQVIEIISKQDPQNLHQVLLTVVHGAVDMADPLAQKTCFTILKRFVELWGDGAEFPAFVDFLHDSIVPACFMAPMLDTFDLNDGQTILCLGESASVLKAAHQKRADDFINFLQNNYLPKLNLPKDAINEYCQVLKSDVKTFKAYVKIFFQKLKT